MLETNQVVRGPREEFRGQKCIARREKCIFIGIELLMFVCALAAMPRHTPSPGRQLGSYLHDTKLSWSLDSYNARRGRAELEARLALWEDSDGALGRKALAAAATAVLAGLAF